MKILERLTNKFKLAQWLITKLIQTGSEKRMMREWYNKSFLPKRLRVVGGYIIDYLMVEALEQLEVPEDRWEEIMDNEGDAFYDQISEYKTPDIDSACDVWEYLSIHHLYDIE